MNISWELSCLPIIPFHDPFSRLVPYCWSGGTLSVKEKFIWRWSSKKTSANIPSRQGEGELQDVQLSTVLKHEF